ncbi:MAG: sugar ABC transporter permease [Firmicutes bacterium]|nr:sugar ABC transporter permease [Bacillota bacterium]
MPAIRKRPHKKTFRKDLPFHLMLLPAVVAVFIFKYIPMGGLMIAFQDYSPIYGLTDQTWVGWENFRYIFSMPQFWNVIRNTLWIASMKIAGDLIVPVIFALLLSEIRNKAYKSTLQTVAFLPHFISWVALAGIFREVLAVDSGIINNILNTLGLPSVFFLGDTQVFPYTVLMTAIWKHFGWNAIIFLAAITKVDSSLFEAAYLDGAGRLKQVWHVTIPCILPIIILMTVLGIGNVLKAGFEQVYNMYSPMVYSTGDIIDTFVYRLGLVNFQFSIASAVGLFQSAVSFVLILLGYWVADRVAGYRVF